MLDFFIKKKMEELKGLKDYEVESQLRYYKDMLNSIEDIGIVYDKTSSVLSEEEIDNLFSSIKEAVSILKDKSDMLEEDLINEQDRVNNILALLKIKSSFVSTIDNEEGFMVDKAITIDSSKVSEKNGSISLSEIGSSSTEYQNKITIVSSNGLPGDTHRAFIDKGEIKYVGENYPRVEVANISKPNATLSYEIFKVPKESYRTSFGDGFSYNEGVSFITDDNSLELKINITLSSAREINEINFIDVESIPFIYSIVVKDRYGISRVVAKDKLSNNFNYVTFQSINATELTVVLTKTSFEKCTIAHRYSSAYKEAPSLYQKTKIGTIGALGCAYDSETMTVIHPKYNDKNYNPKSVKDLFSKEGQIELIYADRLSLSIGGLFVAKKEFESNGFMIKKYSSIEAIGKVTLNAIEDYKKQNDNNYIKYSISLNGETWHDIKPVGRAGSNDIHTVIINNISGSVKNNTKCILSDNDVKDIYLKIQLASDEAYYSPKIGKIELEVRGLE